MSMAVSDSKCPFCDLEGHKVIAVDRNWFAITNAAPRAPISLLFIPRTHLTELSEVTPQLWLEFMGAMQDYIEKHSADFKHGYRIVLNMGEDARQSQPHMHIQLLAGGVKGYDLGVYCTAAGYPDLKQMLELSEKLKRRSKSAA
jgi:histidine triad (HIT) family protein